MGVLHRGHRDVGPLHPGVGATLDEMDSRNRWQTHQIIHREDHRGLHQSVDHETVLGGVDVVPPLVVALEVKPGRRDDAKHPL